VTACVLAGAAVSPELLAGQLLAAEQEAEAVAQVLQAQQEQLRQEEEDNWVSKQLPSVAGATLLVGPLPCGDLYLRC
jgi:hypothetical protein